MNQIKEYDIHEIIKNYPYILGAKFEKLKLTHEKIYKDRTRSDFVFSNKNSSVIVEVKKDLIDENVFKQALDYLKHEKKENPNNSLEVILIGKRTTSQLKEVIKKSKYKFDIKLLDFDVPTQIKLCNKCRKAIAIYNKRCIYCGNNKFIIDPFLFL